MTVSEASLELSDARAVVERLPALRLMPEEVRRLVADSFTAIDYEFGDTIVAEDERADAFYVLASGRARVLKRGEGGAEVPLRMLHGGDAFGELGLVEGGMRVATVRASGQVSALRLDRGVFDALCRRDPAVRAAFELRARELHLANFFKLHSAFRELPDDDLRLLLRGLRERQAEAGETVVREGGTAGAMFVVRDGRLRAYRSVDGEHRALHYLRRGDFFGELSLLHGERRAATVEALEPSDLLELPVSLYRQLLESSSAFRDAITKHARRYVATDGARAPLDVATELLPAPAVAAERALHDQSEQLAMVEEPRGEVAPFAGPTGEFVKPPRRIRRFDHVHQVDEMDCGAACLAMICRHYGRPVSLPRIRDAAGTALDGTSLFGIVAAAEALGLGARGVKASRASLDELPLPAVVHWDNHHWLVLYDLTERHVRVADPARTKLRLPRAEFEERWSGYTALFSYREAFELAPVSDLGVRWLWPHLRPYGHTFLAAVLLALVAAALQLVAPIFTQLIVDDVLPDRDRGRLYVMLGAVAAILVVIVAAATLQRYLLARAAVEIDSKLLDFIGERLLALPMRYFQTRRTLDIERRLDGLRHARRLLVENAVTALTAVAQVVASVGLMVVYDWLLAMVFLAAFPAYGALMRYSTSRLRPMLEVVEEGYGKYRAQQVDAVRGIETVKTIGGEQLFRRLMLRRFQDMTSKIFRANLMVMAREGTGQLIAFAALVLFLWVGALRVLDGALTLGELVAFNALVLLATAPMTLLLSLWDELQLAEVFVTRVNDVLEQEPEQGSDRSVLSPVPSMAGDVELRGVSFAFPGPPPAPVLENIDLRVPAGTRVALVGRSGSGKTTLARLLAGLMEPTGGSILYDGVDIATLDHRELRRHIGVVLQETYLFDASIAANIAFGPDGLDMERVVWAATVANAHDFISRLPLGYDTRVGETGVLLSGGQRQRIAIARAIYRRPAVLILDEATSALDSESERAVQDNMQRLLEGRTSFVIAHRLSTVRDADVIVVLERGRIVERGTHDELMDRQGLYWHLSRQQLDL